MTQSSAPVVESPVAPVVQAVEEGPPASPSVPLPPDPFELAVQAAADIPDLGIVQKELETLFVCYTQYTSPAVAGQTDREGALMELELAQGWTGDTIDAAAQAVVGQLAQQWENLNSRFVAETNGVSNSTTAAVNLDDLSQRFETERREQDDLVKASYELLQMVRTVRQKLELPLPVAVDTSAQAATPSHREDKGKLLGGLKKLTGAFYSSGDDAPVSPPVMASSLRPQGADWLTPPVWSDTDDDVKRFKLIIFKRSQNMPAAEHVWHSLSGLGLKREAVIALIDEVDRKATAQVKQCDEVMKEVTESFHQFSEEIEAVLRMRDVLQSVKNFFFPRA